MTHAEDVWTSGSQVAALDGTVKLTLLISSLVMRGVLKILYSLSNFCNTLVTVFIKKHWTEHTCIKLIFTLCGKKILHIIYNKIARVLYVRGYSQCLRNCLFLTKVSCTFVTVLSNSCSSYTNNILSCSLNLNYFLLYSFRFLPAE